MSRYNKRKCATCCFRRKLGMNIICNYAGITDNTCLHLEQGKVVDSRGGEYNNCKLYKRGHADENC